MLKALRIDHLRWSLIQGGGWYCQTIIPMWLRGTLLVTTTKVLPTKIKLMLYAICYMSDESDLLVWIVAINDNPIVDNTELSLIQSMVRYRTELGSER